MSAIQVWCEGYRTSGESAGAYLLGTAEAPNLEGAISALIADLGRRDRGYFRYDDNGGWTYWGCRIFDNEADARKSFG